MAVGGTSRIIALPLRAGFYNTAGFGGTNSVQFPIPYCDYQWLRQPRPCLTIMLQEAAVRRIPTVFAPRT